MLEELVRFNSPVNLLASILATFAAVAAEIVRSLLPVMFNVFKPVEVNVSRVDEPARVFNVTVS